MNTELKATFTWQYDIPEVIPGKIPIGASWKAQSKTLNFDVYKIILLDPKTDFAVKLVPGGPLDETIIDAKDMFTTNMDGKFTGYEKSDLKFEMECKHPTIASDPATAEANNCCA